LFVKGSNEENGALVEKNGALVFAPLNRLIYGYSIQWLLPISCRFPACTFLCFAGVAGVAGVRSKPSIYLTASNNISKLVVDYNQTRGI
jgi:hypothetical protein